jgi:hypothetical protein
MPTRTVAARLKTMMASLPQPIDEEAARATTDAITHRHAALHVNPFTVSTVSQQL